MTSPPDHPPIRCVLELRYDGALVITRLPGCTQSDVYDILRLLTQSDGPFDYLTILPEYEDETADGMSQHSEAAPTAPPAAVVVSGEAMRVGEVLVAAHTDVTLHEHAKVSITVRPYGQGRHY